ncbi:hypothetical protein Rs2_05968 [Raphanus sativus]|uniref:Uncharacterized protein LOC108840767 n=1 Tax=Raphanus sativus TaxID=3726 RepID=A0A6J0M3L4_RAPSA|nr:uncharacterized protein LOC108840767 [Raphanus sativus]XP_056847857.1 uncharacterized protein LOC108840767 [Raphanus sativus]KAJ4911347.1 hypothetical protein Rs2_05968 [Raphanus sativus]
MSLILSRLSKLRLGKSRRSTLPLLLSNGFSSSLRKKQTPPCLIFATPCEPYEAFLGKLVRYNVNDKTTTDLEKKVHMELVYNDLFGTVVTIGAANGWVATLNGMDGVLRLQDDLNPYASYTDPRRIPLPPLVTLPRCQTQIVTNVSMSSSSPDDDEDCVVAVKFLGPQLSFCRPAHSRYEWVNIRIDNPCFFSSRVVFSKKEGMFRILGAGGHLLGSWDLQNHKHKIQRLRFKNIPELTKTTNELMDSCFTYEHLVESVTTGETFIVKQYKKTSEIDKGVAKMKTENLTVFKLDGEGHAVHTRDIGGLVIFLSMSEPFCVPAISFPNLFTNSVQSLDSCENAFVDLADYHVVATSFPNVAPYFIPPQNID